MVNVAEANAVATTVREPVVVDVREDLRQGRPPLARILRAIKALASGQDLLLLATFEPVPLYRVLAVRGFVHEAQRLPGGDWQVRFTRRERRGAVGHTPRVRATPPPSQTQPPPGNAGAPPESATSWIRLDNRGLEPPEPMIRTFQALDTLPAGAVLEIHNDRRPMFLYPQLRERGLRFESLDAEDGSVFVRIWQLRQSGDDR